jgi:hypothetical protein
MTIEEFKSIDARYRVEKPKLFSLSSSDPKASEDQLARIEAEIGVKLSVSYRAFLQEFGGGEFGLTDVFSACPDSEWFLPARNADALSYLPGSLLPFSDDFAGGLYVLKVKEGQAQEPVFYWNQDGGLVPTDYDDVFEFVAKNAYESA